MQPAVISAWLPGIHQDRTASLLNDYGQHDTIQLPSPKRRRLALGEISVSGHNLLMPMANPRPARQSDRDRPGNPKPRSPRGGALEAQGTRWLFEPGWLANDTSTGSPSARTPSPRKSRHGRSTFNAPQSTDDPDDAYRAMRPHGEDPNPGVANHNEEEAIYIDDENTGRC